jgi:hypothetical protein
LKQLELVHSDLYDPVMPATPGGRCYFLLLVDDASWSCGPSFKDVQAIVEKEIGLKLQVLCTDNGGAFTAAEFAPTVWMGDPVPLLRAVLAAIK